MRILGRELLWSDLPSEFDDWIRREWDHPRSAESLESPWRIELAHSPSDPPRAILDEPTIGGDYGTRHLRRSATEFWIHHGPSSVSVTIGDCAASIVAHGDPFVGWIPLHSAVTEALTASGVMRFHASAIGNGDRTIMFVGPSGRGKSTTLLRGILDGYRPIAEDGCWLEPSSMRLFGLDRQIRLLPDALAVVLDARPGIRTVLSSAGKVAIDFDDLGGVLDDQPLTDLVLLERDPRAATGWGELGSTEAVLAMYQSVGAPHSYAARTFVSTSLAGIADRASCSRLTLGAEPPRFAQTGVC